VPAYGALSGDQQRAFGLLALLDVSDFPEALEVFSSTR
jgi:hypothetical protein